MANRSEYSARQNRIEQIVRVKKSIASRLENGESCTYGSSDKHTLKDINPTSMVHEKDEDYQRFAEFFKQCCKVSRDIGIYGVMPFVYGNMRDLRARQADKELKQRVKMHVYIGKQECYANGNNASNNKIAQHLKQRDCAELVELEEIDENGNGSSQTSHDDQTWIQAALLLHAFLFPTEVKHKEGYGKEEQRPTPQPWSWPKVVEFVELCRLHIGNLLRFFLFMPYKAISQQIETSQSVAV